MRKIFFAIFMVFALTAAAFAQVESIKTIKTKIGQATDKVSLAEQKVSNRIDSFIKNSLSYLTGLAQEEKGKELPRLEPKDAVILTVGNLVLSLFCLLLAISLIAKASVPKKYLWFLFIFNITWLIVTLIAKGVWSSLDYLIIKLQPDLAPRFYDHFLLYFVIATILVYVWLLARTFNLNFFGAVGSFVVAHIAYFFIVAFVFSVYRPSVQNALYLAARETTGARGVMASYIGDMNSITTHTSIYSFIKIKYFHI